MASACLAGVKCRYDGTLKSDSAILGLFSKGMITPFCPELFGEMGIPRKRVQIVNGDGNDVINNSARVIDEDGLDKTVQMITGAEKTASLCETISPEIIFMKSKSPSCGVKGVIGVTSALLLRKGFKLQEVEA